MPDAELSGSLFKPGEIARIISARDIGNEIRLDHSEYGLAIVLDKHRNIVEHLRIGDPPRNLKDDEYILIATTESVRVNYLSRVPDPKTKHEFGIDIEPFYEHGRNADRRKRVRCRVGFLFRIAKNNRNIAQTIHRIMRDEKTNRLSKKDFLANQGRRFSDNVHHIVQTFLNANSAAALESYSGRGVLDKDARATLEKHLNDEGLEYIELLAHPKHETEPQGNSTQTRQQRYSDADPDLYYTEPQGNSAQPRKEKRNPGATYSSSPVRVQPKTTTAILSVNNIAKSFLIATWVALVVLFSVAVSQGNLIYLGYLAGASLVSVILWVTFAKYLNPIAESTWYLITVLFKYLWITYLVFSGVAGVVLVVLFSVAVSQGNLIFLAYLGGIVLGYSYPFGPPLS